MALNQQDMISIVDQLYASTGVGDFDTAETLLTDDFFITEADGLPMAGVYRGRTALRNLYIEVMGMMDVTGLERGPVMTCGETAVCEVAFCFADPALKKGELLELFRFRDGKVCEIKPYYFDPSTIVAACAAKTAG